MTCTYCVAARPGPCRSCREAAAFVDLVSQRDKTAAALAVAPDALQPRLAASLAETVAALKAAGASL